MVCIEISICHQDHGLGHIDLVIVPGLSRLRPDILPVRRQQVPPPRHSQMSGGAAIRRHAVHMGRQRCLVFGQWDRPGGAARRIVEIECAGRAICAAIFDLVFAAILVAIAIIEVPAWIACPDPGEAARRCIAISIGACPLVHTRVGG